MRLIDADALVKALNESGVPYRADVQEVLDEQPTIDVVPLEQYKSMENTCVKLQKSLADVAPVVRCKDCVSFHYSGMGGDNGITYCAKGIEMQPTDFCSYGERKDND